MVMRLAFALALLPLPVLADEALSVELNAVAPEGSACRLSFVAENRLGTDLRAVVFEAVIFNKAGQVDRLALLDFQDLPQDRPRLRQFDVPGLGCNAIGQVLLNAAPQCEGPDPITCMAGLAPSSRVAGVEVAG